MTADQVKERPILFSAPMILALLAGTKTQTRRAVKPVGKDEGFVLQDYGDGYWPYRSADGESGFYRDSDGYDVESRILCPYGKPGERLWVRETFSGPWCMEASEGVAAAPPSKWGESSRIWYWADGDPSNGDWTRPRPSIHMPRWASRILLEITEVRVERLRSISEADALAEGIVRLPDGGFGLPKGEHYHAADPRISYLSLWESINGPGSVEADPWVWAVSFRRLKP